MTESELWELIQLAIADLQFKRVSVAPDSYRDRWVHIDDIRQWVEARRPRLWSAETITRAVRRMAGYGLLEKRTDGIYALKA